MSPCDSLPPGFRAICEGTSGHSPQKRHSYLMLWLREGAIDRLPDGYEEPPPEPEKPKRPEKRARVEPPVNGPNDGSLCIHRGERDGDARCGCWKRNQIVPAFKCAVHGRCSDDDARGVKWCRWCDEFTAQAESPAEPPASPPPPS